MDPLTTAAASGLQARIDSMDLLANNLANTSTTGYKADREFYSTFLSSQAIASPDATVADAPVVERNWTDFSQASLVATGNPTDIALSGKGFFGVNGPNGVLYTRNGALQVSKQGVLTTAEGFPIRMTGGQTAQLEPGFPLVVGSDGELSQNGVPLGQLELTDFTDPSQLTKTAGNYFENSDPKTNPALPLIDTQVSQERLEGSNAQPAESAARMITLLRHFEMLQRAVKIGADMNRQSIEEVARIPS